MREITFDDIYKACKTACKGVRFKGNTQIFEMNLLKNSAKIYDDYLNNNLKHTISAEFEIMERGKLRHIKAVGIEERSMQKALCNYLKPIMQKTFIYDNSASIKNKGVSFALKRIKCHLEKHYRKYNRVGAILVVDIHSFFDSIDHNIVYDQVKKVASNEIAELSKIYYSDTQKGLGLGSENSQILAVGYLNKLDHYIKEKLKIKYYARYNDDFYLIHQDKRYLEYCKKCILKKVESFHLEVNPKKCNIIPLTNEFTFLKKRILLCSNGKVLIRPSKKNIKLRRKTIKIQRKLLDNNKTYIFDDIVNSYMSYKGYTKDLNCYKTLKSLDSLFYNLFHKELDIWLKDNRYKSTKKHYKQMLKISKWGKSLEKCRH